MEITDNHGILTEKSEDRKSKERKRLKRRVSELLEASDGVDEVDVTEELGTAAVALCTKLVHCLLSLAFLCLLSVLLPEVTDWFTAAKAANRDNHRASEPRFVFKPLGWKVENTFINDHED